LCTSQDARRNGRGVSVLHVHAADGIAALVLRGARATMLCGAHGLPGTLLPALAEGRLAAGQTAEDLAAAGADDAAPGQKGAGCVVPATGRLALTSRHSAGKKSGASKEPLLGLPRHANIAGVPGACCRASRALFLMRIRVLRRAQISRTTTC
jgi:hypothetical protein